MNLLWTWTRLSGTEKTPGTHLVFKGQGAVHDTEDEDLHPRALQ